MLVFLNLEARLSSPVRLAQSGPRGFVFLSSSLVLKDSLRFVFLCLLAQIAWPKGTRSSKTVVDDILFVEFDSRFGKHCQPNQAIRPSVVRWQQSPPVTRGDWQWNRSDNAIIRDIHTG